MDLAPSLAGESSFYTPEYGPRILGPRGWHCFGTYGSNGSTILVTPTGDADGPLTGPALFAAAYLGMTSGRDTVAVLRATLFGQDTQDRMFGADEEVEKYPSDHVVRRSTRLAEYTTPANTKGIGTEMTPLSPGNDPVRGVLILQGPESELSALFLATRLPADFEELTQPIINEAIDG